MRRNLLRMMAVFAAMTICIGANAIDKVVKKTAMTGEITSFEALQSSTFLLQNAEGQVLCTPSGWDIKVLPVTDFISKNDQGGYYKLEALDDHWSMPVYDATGNQRTFWAGKQYVNSQPNGGNVIFGLDGVNAQRGQDGPNLALWDVTYEAGKGFAFHCVGRDVYIGYDAAAARPVAEIVYWKAYTGIDAAYIEQEVNDAKTAVLAEVKNSDVLAAINAASDIDALAAAVNAAIDDINASNAILAAADLDEAGKAAAAEVAAKYNAGEFKNVNELRAAMTAAYKAQNTAGAIMTGAIINPSFELGSKEGWTSDNCGDVANNFNFGLRAGDKFCERWTAAPGKLSDGKFTQVLEGMPNGTYTLTATMQNLEQGNGDAAGKGFYVIANEDRTECAAAGPVSVTTTVTDGTLTIGVQLDGCTGNWICFDNFVLTLDAPAAKAECPAISFDVEEGAEVDLAETKSIHISVALPEGVEADADLVIEGSLVGMDGTNDHISGYTDFEDGVDAAISRLTPGNAYQINITKIAYGEVVGMDEETYMPIYENTFVAEEGEALATLNFAITALPQEAPEVLSLTVNPNAQIVAISFDAEDAAPTYQVSFALETEEGTAVNTTVAGDFGQNYGDMIYTFGAPLEAGNYVLVLPAGSMTFLKNGDPFNAEIRVPFTVEGEEPKAELAEGTYYIQNVESGLFMAGANSWGTQASAVSAGEQFAVSLADGVYTITGVTLSSANKTLGYNLYVDTNVSQNGNTWTIAPVAGEEGVYTIYGKGMKDKTADAFDGYIAQSANAGEVTGYVLEGVAEITDAAKWRFLTREEVIASLESGDDATFLITNPNFTRNRVMSTKEKKTEGPWKVSENCTNVNLAGGANNNTCAESYHSAFDIQQIITDAPNGKYSLTVQGFYRQDGEDVENLPVFYANGEEVAVPVKTGEENSMANASASFTNGLYTIEPIEFEVTDGTITLGVKCENTAIWAIWDNFQLTYNGEEPAIAVLPSLTLGEEEEVALNDHSEVSVDIADGIKVAYENVVPMATFYSISTLKLVEGEESSSWEVDEEIVAKTPIMGHGVFQAAFDEPIAFAQGTKYQIAITYVTSTPGQIDPETGMATMGKPVETTVNFIINGAHAAEPEIAAAFINGEEEIAINTKAEVSVETAEALKVNFIDMPEVIGASYTIYGMTMTTDEDGTHWNVNVSDEIAVGELSLNTVGYAEFEAPINFEIGKKYQIAITAYANAEDPTEIATEYFVINGAYEEEIDENLIEIAQDQGKQYDTFARAELVEGEDYNTYTVNADLQIAMKMMDIDVEFCDYVIIKFAEPVAAGWKLAFWSNQDLADVPAGATEYKYVFAEDSKCGVTLDENGVAVQGAKLPQICMMTFFGGYQAPLVAKVTGVYKHSVGTPDAINSIELASKANGKYIENGKIVIVKNGVKYNVAGSVIK